MKTNPEKTKKIIITKQGQRDTNYSFDVPIWYTDNIDSHARFTHDTWNHPVKTLLENINEKFSFYCKDL